MTSVLPSALKNRNSPQTQFRLASLKIESESQFEEQRPVSFYLPRESQQLIAANVKDTCHAQATGRHLLLSRSVPFPRSLLRVHVVSSAICVRPVPLKETLPRDNVFTRERRRLRRVVGINRFDTLTGRAGDVPVVDFQWRTC